jgi:hypothetical protein
MMSLDEAREAYQSFHRCRMADGRIPRDVSIAYHEAIGVFDIGSLFIGFSREPISSASPSERHQR